MCRIHDLEKGHQSRVIHLQIDFLVNTDESMLGQCRRRRANVEPHLSIIITCCLVRNVGLRGIGMLTFWHQCNPHQYDDSEKVVMSFFSWDQRSLSMGYFKVTDINPYKAIFAYNPWRPELFSV